MKPRSQILHKMTSYYMTKLRQTHFLSQTSILNKISPTFTYSSLIPIVLFLLLNCVTPSAITVLIERKLSDRFMHYNFLIQKATWPHFLTDLQHNSKQNKRKFSDSEAVKRRVTNPIAQKWQNQIPWNSFNFYHKDQVSCEYLLLAFTK